MATIQEHKTYIKGVRCLFILFHCEITDSTSHWWDTVLRNWTSTKKQESNISKSVTQTMSEWAKSKLHILLHTSLCWTIQYPDIQTFSFQTASWKHASLFASTVVESTSATSCNLQIKLVAMHIPTCQLFFTTTKGWTQKKGPTKERRVPPRNCQFSIWSLPFLGIDMIWYDWYVMYQSHWSCQLVTPTGRFFDLNQKLLYSVCCVSTAWAKKPNKWKKNNPRDPRNSAFTNQFQRAEISTKLAQQLTNRDRNPIENDWMLQNSVERSHRSRMYETHQKIVG